MLKCILNFVLCLVPQRRTYVDWVYLNIIFKLGVMVVAIVSPRLDSRHMILGFGLLTIYTLLDFSGDSEAFEEGLILLNEMI